MDTIQTQKIFRGSPYFYEKVRGVEFGQDTLDFLSLNLPPLCNYHCVFCFASNTATDKSRLSDIQTRALSTEDYTHVIHEARTLGVKHIEISGEGEPDLPVFRRTLSHIIKTANTEGIHTTVFANGSWVDNKFLDLLRENDASLVISIKYMDRERYDRTVGVKGAFDRVIRNIELARNVLGMPVESGDFQVYRLSLFSGVFEDNETDNAQLREYCDRSNIFFSLSTRIPQGKSEGVIVDFASQEATVNHYTDGSVILADSSRNELGFSVCGTFYYGLGINYDGEVVFDAHADDTKGMIGNIREIGFTEAIRRHREMRDSFYRESGTSYCPLRDASYPDFISRYSKER